MYFVYTDFYLSVTLNRSTFLQIWVFFVIFTQKWWALKNCWLMYTSRWVPQSTKLLQNKYYNATVCLCYKCYYLVLHNCFPTILTYNNFLCMNNENKKPIVVAWNQFRAVRQKIPGNIIYCINGTRLFCMQMISTLCPQIDSFVCTRTSSLLRTFFKLLNYDTFLKVSVLSVTCLTLFVACIYIKNVFSSINLIFSAVETHCCS